MQAKGVLRYALVRSRCEGAERHGNWLPWIKANPDFSEQTTSRIDEGGFACRQRHYARWCALP